MNCTDVVNKGIELMNSDIEFVPFAIDPAEKERQEFLERMSERLAKELFGFLIEDNEP